MRATMHGAAITTSMLVMLTACRTMPQPLASTPTISSATFICANDERALRRDTLYFGRNRPDNGGPDGGTVSDAQWRAFVDDTIVPRFPDGFTVLDAEGYWRGGDGAIVREASKVVIVLHAGEATSLQAIEAIVADYKRLFAQEAVLRERASTCAKF